MSSLVNYPCLVSYRGTKRLEIQLNFHAMDILLQGIVDCFL